MKESDLNTHNTFILTDVYNWLKCDDYNSIILMKTPKILTGFKIDHIGFAQSGFYNSEAVIGVGECKYFRIKEVKNE